jgi:hypothetical protein
MSTTLLQRPTEDTQLELRRPPEKERRIGVWTWVLTVVALLAVTASVVTVMVTSPEEQAAPSAPVAIYENEAEALRALVNLGYIPKEAFDERAYWTERFADVGLIPRHAHPAPLHSAKELATMRLVRQGLLPDELLQTRTFVTKQLVNQGLVPVETIR